MAGSIIYPLSTNPYPESSGLQIFGSPSNPWLAVYTQNLDATTISGVTIFQNGQQVISSGIGAGTITVTQNGGTLSISGTNTAPSGLYVHISGDTMSGGLRIFNPAPSPQLQLGFSSAQGMQINVATASDIDFDPLSSFANFHFGANTSIRNFTIETGNVGIGTANPTQLLEVSGNALIDGTLYAASISGTIISGNTIQISGNSVIVSGTSLGAGVAIFSSKLGNNLQFNSVSGVGTIAITTAGNVVTISGTNEAPIGTYVHISGDVMTGPLYAPVISGSTISGTIIYTPLIQSQNNFSNLTISGSSLNLDSTNTMTIAALGGAGQINIESVQTSIFGISGASPICDFTTTKIGPWVDVVPNISTNQLGILASPWSGTYTNNLKISGATTYYVSGSSNIGTAAIPANQVFANDYFANAPTACQIANNTNAVVQAQATSTFGLASGTYSTVFNSGFSVTAIPNRITYTGSNPFIGNVVSNITVTTNGSDALNFTQQIWKNGSGVSTVIQGDSNNGGGNVQGYASSINWIGPIASGDFFQIAIARNNANGIIVEDGSLSVFKIL